MKPDLAGLAALVASMPRFSTMDSGRRPADATARRFAAYCGTLLAFALAPRRLLACSVLAGFGSVAMPALAQDDHGDTRAAATAIEPNSETAGVLTGGDVDYFKIELAAFRADATDAGGLILRTVGEASTGGRLERQNGYIVETETGRGQGNNFRMDLHLDAGTYYLRLYGSGEYNLLAEFAADDHADVPDEATVVTETVEFDAGFQTHHDEDYFRIELSEPHGLVAQTFGDAAPIATLSRLNGDQIERTGHQGDNFWIGRHLDAGTYLLRVRPFYARTNVLHPYTLLIELAPDDHGGTRETATVMSASSISGKLNTYSDKDTFRFDLREAGELTLQSPGVRCGRLFLPNRRVVRERCGGFQDGFRVREDLSAGTYFLDVTGRAREVAAPYTLDVKFDGDESIPYGGKRHSIPLFISASNPVQQGFARIINRSDYPGTVTITAFDDDGYDERNDPEPPAITLFLDALETQHFNANDLEMGNANKGLSGGVGPPRKGDWRLELETDLDIAALAYTRTPDGLIRIMHDLVPATGLGWTVAFYNPGSNVQRLSVLRLVNPSTTEKVTATIQGIDGTGQRSNTVQVEIGAGASEWIESDKLESGACCDGVGIGDGAGKWQLAISATGDLQVMSLLKTLEGQWTNLSTNSPTADIVQPTE